MFVLLFGILRVEQNKSGCSNRAGSSVVSARTFPVLVRSSAGELQKRELETEGFPSVCHGMSQESVLVSNGE